MDKITENTKKIFEKLENKKSEEYKKFEEYCSQKTKEEVVNDLAYFKTMFSFVEDDIADEVFTEYTRGHIYEFVANKVVENKPTEKQKIFKKPIKSNIPFVAMFVIAALEGAFILFGNRSSDNEETLQMLAVQAVSYESEGNKLSQDNSNKGKKIKELETQIEDLNSRIQYLNLSVELADKEISKLTNENYDLKAQISRLEEEKKSAFDKIRDKLPW